MSRNAPDINNFPEKKIFIEDNNKDLIIENNFKLKLKNKKILLNFIFYLILSFFALSYFLYYLSLEKCFLGIFRCVWKEGWIQTKITELFLSSLLLSILTELMFYKIISFLHLIHTIIIFSFFYKYSHGVDFFDHGYFNITGGFIFYILIIFFILPFNGFFYFSKDKIKIII